MKPYRIIILFIILNVFSAQSQNHEEWLEFNNVKYIKHISNQTIAKDKKATALITECVPDSKGLFQTLKNNPQIDQLYLTNADQNLLNVIFLLTDTQLASINIDNFQSETCTIPACKISTLTEFQIHSEQTTNIEFTRFGFEALDILHVEMENLKEWKGELNLPELGLLDIDCLNLQKMPPVITPKLVQYSVRCSAPFSTDVCDMPDVTLFYFSTTTDCKLSPCHEEVLKREGLIEFVTFSEDEEKRTSIKSQHQIDFEKEMEGEGLKMMEEMNEKQN